MSELDGASGINDESERTYQVSANKEAISKIKNFIPKDAMSKVEEILNNNKLDPGNKFHIISFKEGNEEGGQYNNMIFQDICDPLFFCTDPGPYSGLNVSQYSKDPNKFFITIRDVAKDVSNIYSMSKKQSGEWESKNLTLKNNYGNTKNKDKVYRLRSFMLDFKEGARNKICRFLFENIDKIDFEELSVAKLKYENGKFGFVDPTSCRIVDSRGARLTNNSDGDIGWNYNGTFEII